MNRRKNRNFKSRAKPVAARHTPAETTEQIEKDTAKKGRYFTIFVFVVLLAFGAYHSVVYFGHQVVPNPDFVGFNSVGHQLWSLQLPTNYKRAPVVGLLQVPLSFLVGGRHPDLTASWLLNALLHPFNLILLWLVGRKVVGKSALWLAVIAIINPWVIKMLTESLAETTLLFFVLLTFYFIFRGSKWCYLFASITTMVRYEGAALILAAFVMDMIKDKNKRERICAFVYSVLAFIPLGLWLLGTFLHSDMEGSGHYFDFINMGRLKNAADVLNMLRQVTFVPLCAFPTYSTSTEQVVLYLSKILAIVSFVWGCFYGLFKRRWEILALLIFLVPYMFIHMIYTFSVSRFYTTVSWIVLFISWFGIQSIWGLINKNERIARPVVVILQLFIFIAAAAWLSGLCSILPKVIAMSSVSISMLYVAIGVVAVILVGHVIFYKTKRLWSTFVVSLVICQLIVSNQFKLIHLIGNGELNLEFKLLGDWCVANSKPGEKILTTMPSIVRIFAPEYRDSLVHTGSIKAGGPREFAAGCFEKDITYLAWDSRMGLHTTSYYHTDWGLKNIRMLAKPKSIGPYKFITQLRVSESQFINVFRLQKLAIDPIHPKQ